MTEDPDRDLARPRNGVRIAAVVSVAGIALALALAVWLRFFRLHDPIGGYHAFNEGFYVRLALEDANRGIFAWITSPLDVNNPPLFGEIVSLLFRFLTPSIQVARAVSVLASLATMAVVWRLGEELFDRRTGVISALFLGLMPGVVLVSRNAQVDALLVLCMTSCVLAWVLSSREDDWRWAVASGVALGLGVLTKLPAVIVVPGLLVWECVRKRGVRWLASRRVVAFVASSVVLAAPWFVLRLLGPSAHYLSTQSGIADAAAAFTNGLMTAMVTEPFWLISAPTLVAVVLGVFAMVRARGSGDLLVAVELLSVLAFLVVFHFHTYYWLPATPFVAIIAARSFTRVPSSSSMRVVQATALSLLLAATCLCAVLTLSGQKWGAWSPQQLVPLVARTGGGVAVTIAPQLWDNTYGPAAEIYLPKGTALRGDTTPAAGTRTLISLQAPEPGQPRSFITQTSVRPVLFGVELHQVPPKTHFFRNGPWIAERVGPWWQFGLVSRQTEGAWALYDISNRLHG